MRLAKLLQSVLVVAATSAVFMSCSNPPNGAQGPEESGSTVGTSAIIMALVSVPSDALCLEIAVVPTANPLAETTRRFDITPGTSPTISMDGLPAGDATLTERAFAVACAQVQANTVATWVSAAPVTLTLVAGQTSTAQVVLRRPGNVQITTTFDDGSLTVSPSAVAFGSAAVGSGSLGIVTLTNSSSISLTVTVGTVSGTDASQFSFHGTNCSDTLAAGATCTQSLLFMPTSAGNKTGSYTLGSSTVSLTGTGTLTPVYQIDSGSSSAVSPFAADQYVSGGTSRTITNAVSTTGVANAAPQAVYQSERYGNVTYTFPNLTASATYTVRLHFAELYWTATGKRVFNVSINGTTALSNFDIFSAAQANYKAVVREFTATANSSGQIIVQLTAVTDNATIEGIEILK